MKQSKYIYLLAGPSGSGKSSVARKITEWYGFKEVWSYTERPPRYAGEPGHVFVTPEEFDAAGPMCAFTLYNGYRYGVPQSEIDSSLLYVIDPAGIEYMKNHYAGGKGIAVIGIHGLFRLLRRTIWQTLNVAAAFMASTRTSTLSENGLSIANLERSG